MRVVKDSLGTLEVPDDALYGANAARGALNFMGFGPLLSEHPAFIRAMACVKRAAAHANLAVGALSPAEGRAIAAACGEVLDGRHREHFVVPLTEGSGGTSINMNFNEVIATRANQLEDAVSIHPNDHVNLSQSTNDVVPTAIKLACVLLFPDLHDKASRLVAAFREKAREHRNVLRVGRTCMQAAQPMTYGQLFDGYAALIEDALFKLGIAVQDLKTVPMGGTAIGTGLGAAPGYRGQIAASLSEEFGFRIHTSADPFAGMQATDGFQRMSAELATFATVLGRIAADLVILSSDGASGIGEICLPAVQPGSSIMAGKVNPVIPMLVQQVSMQVHGHHTAVTMACQAGQMEINHFEPLIATALFDQFRLLTAAAGVFTDRCVLGLRIDEERSLSNLARSSGVSTVFLHRLGYEKVVGLVKRAAAENRPLADIAIAEGLLSAGDLHDVLMSAACQPA